MFSQLSLAKRNPNYFEKASMCNLPFRPFLRSLTCTEPFFNSSRILRLGLFKNWKWEKIFGGQGQKSAMSFNCFSLRVCVFFFCIRTAQLLDLIPTTVNCYALQVCVVYDLFRPCFSSYLPKYLRRCCQYVVIILFFILDI